MFQILKINKNLFNDNSIDLYKNKVSISEGVVYYDDHVLNSKNLKNESQRDIKSILGNSDKNTYFIYSLKNIELINDLENIEDINFFIFEDNQILLENFINNNTNKVLVNEIKENIDYEINFGKINVIFQTDMNFLKNLIQTIKSKDIGVYIPYVLKNKFKFLNEFQDLIVSHVNRKKINLETASKFGTKWITNIMKNSSSYIENPGINNLKGIAEGHDVVVCAAGASLFYNIDKIQKIKDKVIVICVDTALRTLVKNSIYPDIVVIFDSQSINATYLTNSRCEYEKMPLIICPPTVSPHIVKKYSKNILFSSIFFNFMQIIDSFSNNKHELLAGGTVTSSAYDLAKYMGAREIFLIGLDLCFSYYQNHSKNSLYEELMYDWQGYSKTYLDYILKIQQKGVPYKSIDNYGRTVVSDVKFKMFGDWFASELSDNTYFMSDRVLKLSRQIKIKFPEGNNCKRIKNKIKCIKNTSFTDFDKEGFKNYMDKIYQQSNEVLVILTSILSLTKRLEMIKEQNGSIQGLLMNLTIFDKKLNQYRDILNILNIMSQTDIISIEFDNRKTDMNSYRFYKSIKEKTLLLNHLVSSIL